jgi:hypothetical protein
MHMHNNLSDILAALRVTSDEDPDYADTLCGPRTRGSTAEAVFAATPGGDFSLTVPDRPLTPIDGASNGAQAYSCLIREINGRLGASALADLNDADLTGVRVRRGAHGVELYLTCSCGHRGCMVCHADENACFNETAVTTFIVGPKGDLWTWFPGPLMGTLPRDCAVKLK